ncbi:hypothetical protein PVA44_06875 (plasmid) [Entomospira nematocerorum]|uniref:Uncharacterized protein n=1 Tax=Entomospira nematocerorum TaxID=2719987 RepID=A0A968KUT6_9SPIO|nr:hypothetical protein [Entomospira nematocera]NIZ47629.1 hypothetical protein [Entomospira nematocera]WDI34633.1 hypothetical protein PVA44_06875 [Entomospira nematocera]
MDSTSFTAITQAQESRLHHAWLTPNGLSLAGKLLAILLVTAGMIVSLCGWASVDMDTLKAGAWTLALVGAPIDASHVIGNLVAPWRKQ